MTVYWIELGLDVSATGEGASKLARQIVAGMTELHDGQVVYTASGHEITLAIACEREGRIEDVPSEVVGTARTVIHEMGFGTPDWPEPAGVNDVQILRISQQPVAC